MHEKYRMRVLMLAGIFVLIFVFYFCWEVLYQERAIVTLLAFTELERSKEADRKNFLHEWILDRGSSKGADAYKEASFDLKKMEMDLRNGVKNTGEHDLEEDPVSQRVTVSSPTDGSTSNRPLYRMARQWDSSLKSHPIEQMNAILKTYRQNKLANSQRAGVET